ncbi:glycosyl hydrolase family 65 protein [Eudoraea sp.]
MFEVNIGKDSVKYSLKKGDGLTIYHGDREIKLSKDKPHKVMKLVNKV